MFKGLLASLELSAACSDDENVHRALFDLYVLRKLPRKEKQRGARLCCRIGAGLISKQERKKSDRCLK